MNRKLWIVAPLALLSLAVGALAASAGPQPEAAPAASPASDKPQPAAPLAVVTSTFTYQGRLTQSGSPANGSYDIVFTLYDAATGGTPIGSPVTVISQTVSGGLFTVPLSFGAGAFDGTARWLDMSVRVTGGGSYTPLTPRQALTAAPYAMSLMPGAYVSGSTPIGTGVLGLNNYGVGDGIRASANTGYGVIGSSLSAVGVYGTGPSVGVYGQSSSGYGGYFEGKVQVTGPLTITGALSGTNALFNSGSFSVSTGHAVTASSAGAGGSGVFGSNSSSGDGVYGTSSTGIGVHGESQSYRGVYGLSPGGYGVYGESSYAYGVYGLSPSGYGVYGDSSNGYGVRARSTSGYAIYATSTYNDAVIASSSSGYGVIGYGSTAIAGYGGPTGVYGSGASKGVSGFGTGYGVYGESNDGTGVYGTSITGDGAVGQASASNRSGVWGNNSGGGPGVAGSSNTGTGVSGTSNSGHGMTGTAYLVNTSGVAGFNVSGTGVYGQTGSGIGVYGTSSSSTGVYGISNTSVGVSGTSTSGTGVYGTSSSGYAGYFSGNVRITGTCCGLSAGYSQIDNPLDPANKYLQHSFVQSPEMKDVYDGNITTDARGEAIVTMPSYFEGLNRDFRYQLTVVGGQFAQAIISSEIKGNRFTIKTDKPNLKVSWQVTGVRHDPYAQAHPITAEPEKPANERGLYLHPELYGQPGSKKIDGSNRSQP
jgi:hypothetical protein